MLPKTIRRTLRDLTRQRLDAIEDPLAYRQRVRTWLDANADATCIEASIRVWNGADGDYWQRVLCSPHPSAIARAFDWLHDQAEGAITDVRINARRASKAVSA